MKYNCKCTFALNIQAANRDKAKETFLAILQDNIENNDDIDDFIVTEPSPTDEDILLLREMLEFIYADIIAYENLGDGKIDGIINKFLCL